MALQLRLRGSWRPRVVLLGCTILHLLGPSETAIAQGRPEITVAEPEGFSELTRDRTLLVDVYFGGVRVGEAMVAVTPDAISFTDPAAVLSLLPRLADPGALLAVLADQPLPANAALACTQGADKSRCGRLSPETMGVILDRDRFRVDIFLNPRFLSAEKALEDTYIPAPGGGLTMINAVGGVISGQTGTDRHYYSLQDQFVVAWGERRLRGDLSLASELGFGAERLALEWDRPERRYSAGALWAPGDELTGRQKLLGLGVETQIDTRRDKEELLGSPVVVFLDRRARIDVVRQGRVLSSAIYEAGNRQIDSSNLPEGSYEITLRIEEAGQPAREDTRFYTKSRRIPSVGRTDFFAYAGLLMRGYDSGALAPSHRPYVQGGLAHRLGDSWALDGSIQATDSAASAQVGLSFLSRLAQVRAAAITQSSGAFGTILQLSSAGHGPFNFNFDIRHFDMSPTTEELGRGMPKELRFEELPFERAIHDTHRGSYTQIGGVVSYSRADFRVLGTFSYRDEAGEGARYSIGPGVEWDVYRHGPLKLTLRGDLTATEQGQSGFAGLAIRFAGRRSSATALAGMRSTTLEDGHPADGAVAAFAGTWGLDALGGDLSIGAGYERQPGQESVVLSSEMQHPLGSLSGDFVRAAGDLSAGSQYAAGFQTSFAAGPGGLLVAGKTTTDSMITARVEGARARDRFELLVNEQVAGVIEGEAASLLRLPSYRSYKLRIRPVGEDLLVYDSSPREVGLFPGVIAKLEWTAAPVAIKIGRLVDSDGLPIRGASISAKGVWAQTDGDGYFQIEVPDDIELEVLLADGRRFAIELPGGTKASGVARLGSVTCCEDTPFQLGASDAAVHTFGGN